MGSNDRVEKNKGAKGNRKGRNVRDVKVITFYGMNMRVDDSLKKFAEDEFIVTHTKQVDSKLKVPFSSDKSL